MVAADRLADAVDVGAALALGLLVEAVGDEGDATALLLVEQVYAVTHCVQQLHEILS